MMITRQQTVCNNITTTTALKMMNSTNNRRRQRRSQTTGRRLRRLAQLVQVLFAAVAASASCLLLVTRPFSVIVDAAFSTATLPPSSIVATPLAVAGRRTAGTPVKKKRSTFFASWPSGAATTASRLFSTSTTSSPPSIKQKQQQQQDEDEDDNADDDENQQQQSKQQQQQHPPSEAAAKSWTDDGFVFGLEGSGLARPGGRTSQIVVDGDSLETQPYQQVLVGSTLVAHAIWMTMSLSNMMMMMIIISSSSSSSGGGGGSDNLDVVVAMMTSILQAVILFLSSYVLADFGSGVLHWSVDNYGNGRTPIMGSIIAAFQGHHSAPWTITERGFCNNVYKLCIPFGIVPMTLFAIIFVVSGGTLGQPGAATFFVSTFCVFEILSQEFHKWSHQLKSETPTWVNALQDAGLTIARQPHALHHMAPYEGNYCIISGICNPALDKFGIFRRLEHFIYQCNGVESNAWKLDASLRAKTLAGDYSLPAEKPKPTAAKK